MLQLESKKMKPRKIDYVKDQSNYQVLYEKYQFPFFWDQQKKIDLLLTRSNILQSSLNLKPVHLN